MKKAKTIEQVIKKFEKLSYKNKCEILLNALGFMQQYNGRSENECIAMAMNYVRDNDMWYLI